MKRFFYLLSFVLLSVVAHGQAKYVFFFIGDGMGINHVAATDMYRAALQDGAIGRVPLTFSQFPVGSMAYTFSESNPVTDSAAAGTALATGVKTYNGAIGVDKDKNPVTSVAQWAKNSGRNVGVATSVSIDHATPAAFFAHQPKRNHYYEIATDLPKAGFDFYAGSGFLKPTTTFDKKEAPSIYPMFDEAGYTLAKGLEDYEKKAADAKRMILIQEDGADVNSLPYALDREDSDLTLPQITEAAIDFLMKGKGKSKGFFLMVEGGKIDWAAHSNDPATVVNEVIDFDEAIKVAYEFYLKYPKETLIVVSADHETGGLSLGNNKYSMNLAALQNQQVSTDVLSKKMAELRKEKQNHVTWAEMQQLLGEQMGFRTVLPISWNQEKKLRDEFEKSFVNNRVSYDESLYSSNEKLATVAKEVMSEIAMVNWGHGSHTAGFVPVFAVGNGSQLFSGAMHITDIPKKIAKAANYKN